MDAGGAVSLYDNELRLSTVELSVRAQTTRYRHLLLAMLFSPSSTMETVSSSRLCLRSELTTTASCLRIHSKPVKGIQASSKKLTPSLTPPATSAPDTVPIRNDIEVKMQDVIRLAMACRNCRASL